MRKSEGIAAQRKHDPFSSLLISSTKMYNVAADRTSLLARSLPSDRLEEQFYDFCRINCIPADRFESFHSKPPAVESRRNFYPSVPRMIIITALDTGYFSIC